MQAHAPTVIVPCHNERGAIEQTITQLRRLGPSQIAEILVVDDASDDGTGEQLRALGGEPDAPPLRTIRHTRRRGYGAALKTGIRAAETCFVAITDADGTYPNDRLPELTVAAAETDMVIGQRMADPGAQDSLRRLPRGLLRRWVQYLAGEDVPDMNSGFRVMRRDAVRPYLRLLPDGFSFTTTVTLALLRSGHDVRFVPVPYAARVGHSKIRPVRDTLRFVALILRTGMQFAPLRMLTPLIALLGTGFLASVLYDVFVEVNLTDKTVILLMFTLNTSLFAMLADMIEKRTIG